MAVKKSKWIFLITVAALILTLVAIKYYNAHRFYLEKRTCFMMDTYVTIYAIGPGKMTVQAIGKAFDRMQEIDEKFNHLNSQSPIYTFNQRGTPITDREIVNVAGLALEVSKRSEGAFDITILPIAELWGFYGEKIPHVPADNRIKECLNNTGYKGLRIEDGALKKTNDKIRIDLGGIAKGYAISESVKVLKAEGIKSALIDAGGDVYALGRRGNRLWKVGIKNPHGEGLLGYLEVEDLAIMGSGDYERFFMEGGKKYHHIFDPKTGYPSEGLSGITLVHPDPLVADAWNTALFVMGPKRAMEAVESIPSMETIEVTTAGEVSFSSGLKDALQVISNNK